MRLADDFASAIVDGVDEDLTGGRNRRLPTDAFDRISQCARSEIWHTNRRKLVTFMDRMNRYDVCVLQASELIRFPLRCSLFARSDFQNNGAIGEILLSRLKDACKSSSPDFAEQFESEQIRVVLKLRQQFG